LPTGLASTTHLPIHPLGFLGGGQKTQKSPLWVKIIDLFWKKIQFILGYSNFL
jgi:hypothetical protein